MKLITTFMPLAIAMAISSAAGAAQRDKTVPVAANTAPESTAGDGPQGLPVKEFAAILSENIKWQPFPAFPPEARLAVLIGDPRKPGPYVVRVKLPAGIKLMPHTHPEDRIYTVLSGVFYIGLGTSFAPDKLKAYAPGSIVILPGNTPHFHWAKSGEYITQVAGSGPLGIKYVQDKDDPRHH